MWPSPMSDSPVTRLTCNFQQSDTDPMYSSKVNGYAEDESYTPKGNSRLESDVRTIYLQVYKRCFRNQECVIGVSLILKLPSVRSSESFDACHDSVAAFASYWQSQDSGSLCRAETGVENICRASEQEARDSVGHNQKDRLAGGQWSHSWSTITYLTLVSALHSRLSKPASILWLSWEPSRNG